MFQESVSVTSDRIKWDNELKRELTEAKDNYKANYENAMKQYEKDLEHWTEMHRKSENVGFLAFL